MKEGAISLLCLKRCSRRAGPRPPAACAWWGGLFGRFTANQCDDNLKCWGPAPAGSPGDGQQRREIRQEAAEHRVAPRSVDGESRSFITAMLQPKPSRTRLLRGGRRNQWQGGVVGAQDLHRQVAQVEAGQCPHPSFSFLSMCPLTVRVAGTDTPALAGNFPQHCSSNPGNASPEAAGRSSEPRLEAGRDGGPGRRRK